MLDVNVGEVSSRAVPSQAKFACFFPTGKFVRRVDNAIVDLDDAAVGVWHCQPQGLNALLDPVDRKEKTPSPSDPQYPLVPTKCGSLLC